MDNDTNTPRSNTNGFFVQAVIAFAVSLIGLAWSVLFLPLDPWARAFLGMTALFLVSSTITLSKVVRDNQEVRAVHHRIDQARIERMLAEHDPFRNVA